MVFGIQLGGSGGNNSAAVKQEDSETTNSNGKAPAAPAAKTVNRQQPLQPAPPGPTNRASPAASSIKTDTNTHDTPKTTGNNNNSSKTINSIYLAQPVQFLEAHPDTPGATFVRLLQRSPPSISPQHRSRHWRSTQRNGPTCSVPSRSAPPPDTEPRTSRS